MRSIVLGMLAVGLLAACGKAAREYGTREPSPDEQRALTPRDLTGRFTSYEETYGADSLYFPRIFHYTGRTIGISLRQPAHVAVLMRGAGCPSAPIPGHDLSTRLPAGFHYLQVREPTRGRCDMNWWLPAVAVIASELPLHGEVLEQRARNTREAIDLMENRRDQWSMYVVYRSRDGR